MRALLRLASRSAADIAALVILKLAVGLLSILPESILRGLAKTGGRVVYATSRSRRRIAMRNVEIAFRDGLTPDARRTLVRSSFQHFALGVVGFALRRRFARARRLAAFFEISPAAESLLSAPSPHGLAFLSAHVGDWEMAHLYLALRGIPVSVVTREVASRPLDGELSRLRAVAGAKTISKRGAMAGLRASLRAGDAVGLLADQNCPTRERFFPFLGVPASTYTRHARLLVRLGARVVFVTCLREGLSFRYRLVLEELESGSREAATTEEGRRAVDARADELVRRYLAVVERLVVESPEQYLWMHRRWKSRPTGAPWLYHDLGKPLDLRLLEAGAA